MNNPSENEYPKTLKCYGAIVYYTDQQPTSYLLTIKDVVEPQPAPGTIWKRVPFKEAYETFDTIREQWHADGTAKAWDHLRPWQIHLSTALFLMLFAGAASCIDFYLWDRASLEFTAVGIGIAATAVVALQAGVALVLTRYMEGRIRRRRLKLMGEVGPNI